MDRTVGRGGGGGVFGVVAGVAFGFGVGVGAGTVVVAVVGGTCFSALHFGVRKDVVSAKNKVEQA